MLRLAKDCSSICPRATPYMPRSGPGNTSARLTVAPLRCSRLVVECKKPSGSKKARATGKQAAASSLAPQQAASSTEQAPVRTARAPAVVRKYRRPKKTADDLKHERHQQQVEWKASLQLPLEEVQHALRQQASRLPGVILVDAYNVIGAWPELERLKLTQSLQAAREQLQEHAAELAVKRGQRVILVYDALEGNNNAGVTKYRLAGKVSVVFSAQHSADIYLCEEAEFWVQQGVAEVLVVTNDNNVRHSVTTAGVARDVHCMPVSWMVKECGEIRQQLLREVKLHLHKEQLEWQRLKKLTA